MNTACNRLAIVYFSYINKAAQFDSVLSEKWGKAIAVVGQMEAYHCKVQVNEVRWGDWPEVR